MLISEQKLRYLIRQRLINEALPAAMAAAAGAATTFAAANPVTVAAGVILAPLVISKVLQQFEGPPQDDTDRLLHWKTGSDNIFDSFKKTFQEAGYKVKLNPISTIDQLAKNLYDATKGGLTGIGTDEDSIGTVFSDMRTSGTLMDCGYIAQRFWENHAKSGFLGMGGTAGTGIGSQLSLFDVLQDELTDADYQGYVKKYLSPSNSEDESTIKLAILIDKEGKEVPIWLDQLENIDKLPGAGGEVTGGDKIDINSLSGSNVEKIEQVLLKYCQKYSLTTPEGFTPDSTWDGTTDELYLLAVNHGFGNHPIFKGLDQASKFSTAPIGELKWKSIVSVYLVGQGYPGYTGNPTGLLNFLVDLYNGEDSLGKTKTSGGGSGGSGSGSKKRSGAAEKAVGDVSSGATVGAGDVRIRVIGDPEGRTTVEDFGGSSSELAQDLIDKLKGSNFSGETINLSLMLNRKGEIASIRKARGQRRSPAFENVKVPTLNYFKRLNVTSDSKDKRGKLGLGRDSLEVVIKFPAGKY